MFKVGNKNRRKYEICQELTIKSPDERLKSRSFDFIVNFEQILQLVPASILLILSIFLLVK